MADLSQLPSCIPIFSLNDLHNNSQSDEFLTCLSEIGVFYLKDYGMSDLDHILPASTAMTFFEESSEEEKNRVMNKIPSLRRGFSRLGSESTAKVTNAGDYSDYSMCFSMGISDNLFPSKGFEEIWSEYFEKLYHVAQEMAKCALKNAGFVDGLKLDEFLDCEPVLRFRNFPQVPRDRCAEFQPLRMAPHYDVSTLTLIHQTPCPNGFVSLQCDVNGKFVDIPSIPNTIVVMCGSVGTLVSNGKIKAPKHRVVAPNISQQEGSNRTSSVFFLRPKSDFSFSVPYAKQFGFAINLSGERATFKDWVSGNYTKLNTDGNVQ